MMRKPIVYILALVAVIFALSLELQCGGVEVKRVSVSVPGFKLENRDRVVEFKATIVNGFVVSVPRIPPGWFFRVDLPYQWKTEVAAGSIVGVADLTVNDAEYFNHFLVIEYTGHKEEELRIEVEIVVDTYEDQKKTLHYRMEELQLTKISEAGKQ